MNTWVNTKWKRSGLIFSFAVLIIALAYNYHVILLARPAPWHEWRQCDCLSITLNYCKENRAFLNPSVHWIGKNGTGETISELPIIYYTVGQLWKIFGPQEIIFRLFVLIILFCALFFLFRTFEMLVENSFWALFSTILLFTSPIWIYYGNNFLADVPALSFSLIGWYFFFRFYSFNKNKYLWASFLFFLLGGLLKITSLLSFTAILGIFLLEIITKLKIGLNNQKLFTEPKKQMIPFVILPLLIVGWYYYAIKYNETHNDGIFLTGILPIWKLHPERIRQVWIGFSEWISFYFYSRYMVVLLLSCFLFNVINFKKANKLLSFINIFQAGGVMLFFLLWYDVFDVHDYYMTNLLIFPVLVLLNTVILLKNNFKTILSNKIFISICMLFLFLNIYYASEMISIRYFRPKNKAAIPNLIIPSRIVDLMDWTQWDYITHRKPIENVQPYLRSLGINRTDKVISIPDGSINVSLYLMDQKGFTDYSDSNLSGIDRMHLYIRSGAKYLIINDQSGKERDYIQPYLKNKIGNYQSIEIYDLRDMQ